MSIASIDASRDMTDFDQVIDTQVAMIILLVKKASLLL
jgi:hypothetical protein